MKTKKTRMGPTPRIGTLAALPCMLWMTTAGADGSEASVAPAINVQPILADARVAPVSDTVASKLVQQFPAEDPTGGAYVTPTLLFVPAGAVPKWNVRAIASTEVQSPSDVHAGVRPGLGAEVGLPGGLTLGAGTTRRW